MRGPDPPVLAAVVPTLDEATRLPGLLADLGHLRIPWELVVSDGGSTDGTVDLARQGGARVVTAPPGSRLPTHGRRPGDSSPVAPLPPRR